MAHKKDHFEQVGEIVSLFRRGRWYHANYQINGQQRRVALKITNHRQAVRRALEIEQSLLEGKEPRRKPAPSVAEAVANTWACFKPMDARPRRWPSTNRC
ncbi:MAG: hypothetical protein LLG01_16715 [Planctomycetaceae bacterium]|nr:hypothetical protein [Planctomycetaceae bacterium]